MSLTATLSACPARHARAPHAAAPAALHLVPRAAPPLDLAQLPAGAVLLHAGQHKTGSTAVQNALDAAPALLDAAGWVYPEAGRVRDAETGHRHRQLTMEMLGHGTPEGWTRLRESITGETRRVLVSHEGLFAPAIDPQRIARQLPGHEVHALVYLRHPVDYIDSSFREWTRRWRLGVPMRDWYLARRAWLDVAAMRRRWEAALGEGRVHFRAYSRRLLAGGSVLTDFAAALGLPALPAADAPANTSLNTRQTVVHWVANRVRSDPGQRQALSDLVADAGAAASARAQLDDLAAGFDDGHKSALARVLDGVRPAARLVDDALAEEIEAAWLAGYRGELAAQGRDPGAWGGDWRALPFDDGLADAELRRAVRALLGA